MKLILDSAEHAVSDPTELASLLEPLRCGESSRAILEKPNGHFIQSGGWNGRFLLEKQLGGLHEHFEAIDPQAVSKTHKLPWWRRLFHSQEMPTHPFEDILATFNAFAADAVEPSHIIWRKKFL